jgi:hypothetical protein
MKYSFGVGICRYCWGKGLIRCPLCDASKKVQCTLCGGKGVIETVETQPTSEPQQTEGKSPWAIAALALTTAAVVGVAALALTRKKREKKKKPQV